jgi:hypothetical protein
MVDRGSLRRSFLTTSIGVRFPPPRRWRMQRHDHVSSNPPRRSSRYQARKPARAQLALCRRAEHAVGGHQVFPGIRIKVLYSDDSGITTALFKLDPGAVVPLHEHVALEQRTMKACADLASLCGVRRVTSMRQWRLMGPSFWASSSSQTASPMERSSSLPRAKARAVNSLIS